MIVTRKKKKGKIGGRSKMVFYVCMMALPLLQFVLLWFCVNINSILLAFQRYDYDAGAYVWNAFDNFKTVFSDFVRVPFYAASLRNTVVIYLIGLVVGTPLSVLFSFYLYKKMPLHGLFKTILFVPHILSALIMVVLFKYFVDRAVPTLVELMTGKTINGLLANPKTTLATIIFYNVWTGFGTSTVMYSSTMAGISDSVVEAAKLDGITPMKELLHITIPMIWPTFATFVVVGFAGLFMNQAALYNFYGNDAEYRLYTFGYYFYVSMRTSSISQYPYLAALGLILTAVALPLTLGLRKLMDRLGPKTI